jgi:predicted transcriptional regulator
MTPELALAAIRDGNLTAAEAWKLVSPFVETDDKALAMRLSNALRAWAWKALDRRRRDAGLREWIDLLNRVEGFLADRFEAIAARIEVLVELLHESIAVATAANPESLVKRKHVASILHVLERQENEWLDRAALMDEVSLKPANTTRLMALLVDIGWAEQETNGREAKYRLSTEGIARARKLGTSASCAAPMKILRDYEEHFFKVVMAYGATHLRDAPALMQSIEPRSHEARDEWKIHSSEFADSLEVDHHDDEELEVAVAFQPGSLLVQAAGC